MAGGLQRDGVLSHLAVEVLAQVHRVAPRSHLAPLLETAAVLVPLGALGSRSVTGSRAAGALGALAGAALTVALALTLFRGAFGHESLGRLRSCVVTDPTALTADGLANVALFAPAAFLGVLAVGHPWRVALGVTAVSLLVEAVQAVEWVGVCDSSDAVHNALGGLAAALLAAALRRAVPGSGPCRGSC